MILADLPLSTSIVGYVTPILLTALFGIVAFFMRRAIKRSDDRNKLVAHTADVVAALETRMTAAEERQDRHGERQDRHDEMMSRTAEALASVNATMTAHLSWSATENDYVRRRLDHDS